MPPTPPLTLAELQSFLDLANEPGMDPVAAQTIRLLVMSNPEWVEKLRIGDIIPDEDGTCRHSRTKEPGKMPINLRSDEAPSATEMSADQTRGTDEFGVWLPNLDPLYDDRVWPGALKKKYPVPRNTFMLRPWWRHRIVNGCSLWERNDGVIREFDKPRRSKSIFENTRAYDRKHKIPRPAVRVGQIWAGVFPDGIRTVTIENDNLNHDGKIGFPGGGALSPRDFEAQYKYLLADPICLYAAPWSAFHAVGEK